MPQAAIALLGIALVEVAEISAWIVSVATLVATYAWNELTKPDSPATPTLAGKAQTTTVRSGVASHKIVYGKTQVGGVLVYLDSSGDENEYAHMVVVMAPHEVESIGDVWFNDKLATEFDSDYYRIKKHLGTSDQVADSDLISECEGLDSNFRLRGVAYVYVRFKFDRDVWPTGMPRDIKAIVTGKKVYDPRDVAQAPDDPSTWTWSDNWALIMRDFITSPFGMAALSAEIDDDNISAAANVSAEQVIKYDSTYQDRYTVNGTVDTADNLAANRDVLAAAGGGYAPWVEGTIKVVPGVYTPPVSQKLSDDDLRGDITIRPRTPRQDIFNAVKGVYMGPDTDYKITEFPPVTNSFYEEQDGDEQIFTDIELGFCDDPDRAQRLAKLKLEIARQPIVVNFPGKWTCFPYTVGDCVSLTLTAGRAVPIWEEKEFKVVKWSLSPEGEGVDLVLREESSAAYDWNQGDLTWYDAAPDVNLPSIFTPPPSIANVSVTEAQYDYRLQTFTRLTVNFDKPANYPYFDHIEVQHSTDGVNYKQLPDQRASFTIDPVSEGETHYFYLKAVSTARVGQSNAESYYLVYGVEGKVTPPSGLTGLTAIVNANTVNLFSDKVSDSDVELYEFRMGVFNTGIFLSAMRSPNLSLYGVKPGSHTFSCNTLGTNGVYGAVPVSASAFLSDPPLSWTVIDTELCDYSTGTHDNTEAYVYNLEDYLKCSHTSGLLVGTFVTPEYDLGSVAERLFYALADIVVTGTGTTWDNKFAAGATWDELGITGLTWNEIFELSEAPKVEMTLIYGETSPPTNRVEKMEILSTVVTSRYFQLEIKITDPIAGMNALVESVQLKHATR